MYRSILLVLVSAIAGCADGRTYTVAVTARMQAATLASSLQIVFVRTYNGARQSNEFPLSSPMPAPWMLSFTGVTWPADAPFEADAEARDGTIVVAAGQGMPKGTTIAITLTDLPVFPGTDLAIPPEDVPD